MKSAFEMHKMAVATAGANNGQALAALCNAAAKMV